MRIIIALVVMTIIISLELFLVCCAFKIFYLRKKGMKFGQLIQNTKRLYQLIYISKNEQIVQNKELNDFLERYKDFYIDVILNIRDMFLSSLLFAIVFTIQYFYIDKILSVAGFINMFLFFGCSIKTWEVLWGKKVKFHIIMDRYICFLSHLKFLYETEIERILSDKTNPNTVLSTLFAKKKFSMENIDSESIKEEYEIENQTRTNMPILGKIIITTAIISGVWLLVNLFGDFNDLMKQGIAGQSLLGINKSTAVPIFLLLACCLIVIGIRKQGSNKSPEIKQVNKKSKNNAIENAKKNVFPVFKKHIM